MYILSQHSCSCIWHLNHILLYSHTLQTPDTLWMLQTESSKEVPILLEFYYCLSSHNLQGMEGSAEVLNIDSRYHFDTDCVLYVTIGRSVGRYKTNLEKKRFKFPFFLIFGRSGGRAGSQSVHRFHHHIFDRLWKCDHIGIS